MKKLLVLSLLFVFAAITSCSNGNSKNLDSESKVMKSEIHNLKKDIVMEHLTKETFLKKVFNYEENKDWKYEGDLPCIIDFYADWCGPCKMVAPVLEELAKEYDGKVNIYKVDTEAERELAAAFGIRSIPSILFCPKEGQPQMAMGALPKPSIEKAINEILLAEENVNN
ncbi:MAG: thioredoxin [Candidatus Cyclobacteriaceae bacterium M3_2C_046]